MDCGGLYAGSVTGGTAELGVKSCALGFNCGREELELLRNCRKEVFIGAGNGRGVLANDGGKGLGGATVACGGGT